MSALLQQLDPNWIDERRKEWKRYVNFFGEHLAKIVAYMPAPVRVLDMKTGEWSVINNQEWQTLIDKRTKEYQDFLKKEFPELYPTDKQIERMNEQ